TLTYAITRQRRQTNTLAQYQPPGASRNCVNLTLAHEPMVKPHGAARACGMRGRRNRLARAPAATAGETENPAAGFDLAPGTPVLRDLEQALRESHQIGARPNLHRLLADL